MRLATRILFEKSMVLVIVEAIALLHSQKSNMNLIHFILFFIQLNCSSNSWKIIDYYFLFSTLCFIQFGFNDIKFYTSFKSYWRIAYLFLSSIFCCIDTFNVKKIVLFS